MHLCRSSSAAALPTPQAVGALHPRLFVAPLSEQDATINHNTPVVLLWPQLICTGLKVLVEGTTGMLPHAFTVAALKRVVGKMAADVDVLLAFWRMQAALCVCVCVQYNGNKAGLGGGALRGIRASCAVCGMLA